MLRLKIANLKDAETITKNRIAAYNKEHKENSPEGVEGGPPDYDSVQCTMEGIKSNIYYLILLEDNIIGSFWLSLEKENHFELEDFVIHPDYQNLGYGTACIDMMEKKHPDITLWTLATPSFSRKNQHFYEKCGYQRIGKSENNYCVLYEKTKLLR